MVFLRIDRVDWALGYAHRAVNAAVRIDGQKIGSFNKAIYGANINAVGVFATDAALRNNMGHSFFNSVLGWGETFKVDRYVLVPRRSGEGVTVGGIGEFVQRHPPAIQRAVSSGVVQAVAIGQRDVARL